jgi:HAE1 family hydrophobic/amphiphilic exporter-1
MKFRISAWAIRNPIPVAIVFVALTLMGMLAYARLPIKHFPNVTFPAVSVAVTQNGAAPAEMESQVTRPIENALAGITNLKHISSSVTLGSSITTVDFELGTDLQKAVDDVRSAVDRTRVNLPVGIDPPTVQRIEIDSAPILTYAVSSTKLSTSELSWFIDDTVARSLQALHGVAQVGRLGGVDREINVVIDPQRMVAFGVTAPQVNDALRTFNTDESGGRAAIGGGEQTVRVLGSADTVAKIRDTLIPVGGRYVRLSDVADVGDGSSEQRQFALYDGRPTVAFQVNKTRDSSDVQVEADVTKAMAVLAKENPDVHITPLISTVKETRESYSATKEGLLEGMALAALVVLLFLRNFRATFIAAAAMPLSLIPTFMVMSIFGFSLNVITLLALTLVIGILVDDAIVEIENIEKRVEQGQTPYRAALVGADSIGLAVVATTFSIVAVFTPVSFMGGISGQFFKEFGLTVSVSVLFSLAVARLLTPLMAAYFLLPTKHPKPRRPLGGFYLKSLNWALDHKWLSSIFGFIVFIGAMLLFVTMPFGFQPTGDAGYFYLNMEGPPGASRADMERAALNATQMLLKHNDDVDHVFVNVGGGSGGGFGPAGGADLRNGTMTVVLKQHRAHTTEGFKKLLRPEIRAVPDVRVNLLSGFGQADVDIVLSSENGPLLEKTQLELEREMRTIKGITDVRLAPPPPGPELVVRPKDEEASRLNVSTAAIAQVARVATIGDIDPNVAKYSEGKRRIPIRVRLPEYARSDINAIGALRVATVNGKSTPLSTVADLSFQAGPGQIIRYGRERRASVQADRAGVSLSQAISAVNKLPIMRRLPDGVKQAAVGDVEAFKDLITGFIGAILSGLFLIFAVLVLLFRSFFKPAVILAALPLTMAGAVAGLKVTGMEVSMPVLIGLLMLFGIAAKNSILLVEFAIEDERAGQTTKQALFNACRERARPIIMTTMAMAAGMLPTALGIGQGSEFRQPMAIAVIGGLISSTLLSLVLVPVVYEVVDGFERWITPIFGRFVTPKQPGDDDPIRIGEETLVTEGAPAPAE